MKQKIIIKNFGPIKDVEMEIDDFTIFIGPQTSGKSTIAKSVFFFMSLRDDMMVYLRKAFDENKIKDGLDGFAKIIINKYNDYWGTNIVFTNDSLLKFYYTDIIWIEIKSDFSINFSPSLILQFLDIVKNLKDNYSKINTQSNSYLTSKHLAENEFYRGLSFAVANEQIENNIFEFDGDLLFIPAGRSILSTLSEQIQDMNPRSLDPLMKTFIERVNTSKGMRGSDDLYNYNLHKEVKIEDETLRLLKILSESILNGSYFKDDEEGDKIKIINENYIELLFASSGQQETVWIIQMVLLLILNKQKVFIVIEEPEAHLFPKTQKDILNLIVLLSNTSDNKIFITTHSPYILTSLNNNIYAYQVGQQHEAKVDKIIDRKLWMNPNKVQAYFVGGKDNKGKIRSIIHPELQIIQTEEIDSASSINNEEYDLLFDLD